MAEITAAFMETTKPVSNWATEKMGQKWLTEWVRGEILTAVTMKITVFGEWHRVIWHKLTYLLQERASYSFMMNEGKQNDFLKHKLPPEQTVSSKV
jgi:hypothetical protein